jgi:hypothetical protein
MGSLLVSLPPFRPAGDTLTIPVQTSIAIVEATLGEPLGDLEVIVRSCAANAENAKLLGVTRGSAPAHARSIAGAARF